MSESKNGRDRLGSLNQRGMHRHHDLTRDKGDKGSGPGVAIGRSLGECSNNLCGDVEEEDGGDEGEGEDNNDEWVTGVSGLRKSQRRFTAKTKDG